MGSILGWIFEKTNGYKSILGYITSAVARVVEAKFPGAPAAEIATVIQYIGETLLVAGLTHKAVKQKKVDAAPAPKVLKIVKKKS